MLTLPPLSLYVHIPWCVRKCPYCDFNSHQAGDSIPHQDYLAALLADLKTELSHVQGRRIHSVFFGGGTPSLIEPDVVATVLDTVAHHIGFEADAEVTLEANPGTVDQHRFAGFRAAGVNRLSIGIQSFDNAQLQRLGRIHDRAAAISAVNAARRAGFDNLNLDLMHGLPEQTPAAALADLELATQLEPEHMSWYQLTIEPNTLFFKQPPALPEDDTLSDIQDAGECHLAEAGYRQYEISAYAREGRCARHNLNYWQFGDYIGIGAGAHGKITVPDQGLIIRTSKTRAPADYLSRQDSWLASSTTIANDELPLEFMMNALRLNRGVAPTLFPARTGLGLQTVSSIWERLRAQGLVMPLGERIATTPRGLRFLNQVLEQFTTG